MLTLQARAATLDYGNIHPPDGMGRVENAFDFPGFVPAYIRPAVLWGSAPSAG